MKIKEGFLLRSVMGNNVIIAVGSAGKDFRKMVTLNATAAEIWKLIESGKTENEIVDELVRIYEVERDRLEADVHKTIETLIEQGFVEA